MSKRTIAALLLVAWAAAMPAPARAWVAAGGYRGGAAIAYHPPCCYNRGAVAGAAVAGAVVGAAAATTAAAAYASEPVYYSAPDAYAPAEGTVVASLPEGCGGTMSINGVSYVSCGGVFYTPFYSGGALMYRAATP